MLIQRTSLEGRVENALRRNPVVALLGPRQCGKTTLARQFLKEEAPNYFDLEDPTVWSLLAQPRTVLDRLRGLVVIDEAQRRPELFPVLRVLADRARSPAKFLILGSASPELSRQASESLAGRVEIVEMHGFRQGEVDGTHFESLWLRGGFPRSFLAEDDASSDRWRRDFIRTFLERDLAQLGFGVPPAHMQRLWTMISHYHGQIWNASEVAASLGISPPTARRHLDVLEQTYMIRQLQPWYANIGKRQVKSPKLYLRDSGLFHRLQGIQSWADLQTHPKLGASWEGFALEEVVAAAEPDETYFWAVHSGSEMDLLLRRGRRLIGVEFKFADAPTLTRSMHIALADLKLDELLVIYPGARSYELSDKVKVVPLRNVADIWNKG